MPSVSLSYSYVERCYAEWNTAECRYAECHYDEDRGTQQELRQLIHFGQF